MTHGNERFTLAGLVLLLGGAFVLASWVGRSAPAPRVLATEAPSNALPDLAYQHIGTTIEPRARENERLLLAHGAKGVFEPVTAGYALTLEPDRAEVSRMLATPISLNWRHPLSGLPAAQIIRVARAVDEGRSEERLHTMLFQDHGALPVLSLVLPTGALLDPDTGLLVVGNAIFQAPKKMAIAEARDPRWWKYPGNFHMRGKAWERAGRMQFIRPDGTTGFETAVKVRVNGQMTRGFPQHAFRIGFHGPLRYDLFDEVIGEGYDAMVVRAAGNDQVKAMLRDAFQHELCKGSLFEVSGHRSCVVYLNGAYWGVHHLRPRMDEEEIARRYVIDKKDVTILEDEARFYRGDEHEVAKFESFTRRAASFDGASAAWLDTLHATVDVDGFLQYMASQMILGNMDWPNQNVKFWKYSGEPKGQRPLDGRWYFIMGDSDLGFGAQAGPQGDMFHRTRIMDVPVTRLFWAMMRAPVLKARFIALATALANGPFHPDRSLAVLDRFVDLLSPEMERHTARWRKPADVPAWSSHIEVMRTYARERSTAVLKQLKSFEEQP